MILALIPILSASALGQKFTDEPAKMIEMTGLSGKSSTLMVAINPNRIDPPKLSPKQKWTFEWLTAGYGTPEKSPGALHLRFRVFSQERKTQNDSAESMARTLVRLWNYNDSRLRLDHAELYNGRIVDVYICFGGRAGGEQRFDLDEEKGQRRKVNTIYIYDLASFKDPLERVREVAHEYGHATLPPTGPFKAPEDWANGELGERLYVRHLRDLLKAGKINADDTMQASFEQLDGYVRTQVDPLTAPVAKNGPDEKLLRQSGKVGMNAYLGLALYSERVLPPDMFARAMALDASQTPIGFAKAVVEAASERPRWQLPGGFKVGQSFWIPIGKGAVSGATVLTRRNGWANIRADSAAVSVFREAGSIRR